MEPVSLNLRGNPPSAATRDRAALICGVALILGASMVCESWVFPFVHRDISLVYLLCAFPLAGVLAVRVGRRLSPACSVGLSALALAGSAVPLFAIASAGKVSLPLSLPLFGVVCRALTALALCFALTLVWTVLLGERLGLSRRRMPAAHIGLWMVVLLAAPWTYVGARCRHDVAKLGDLLEQSRLGEALDVVQGLSRLGYNGTCRGQALQEVLYDIDGKVILLEIRVLIPLKAQATDAERLDLARALAMLGRNRAALETLGQTHEPASKADVENLRGTIYETDGEWATALGSYRNALREWDSRPPSAARAAGVVRATTGVAYCQRKLGKYSAAAASYLQLLALSPTADSHFLLARFYEDAQDVPKAQQHARRAMALAPARYGKDGEKLLNKLAVFHFGCLSVSAPEGGRP